MASPITATRALRALSVAHTQAPQLLTVAQNSKSLRRLAADHGSLHTAGLPPNYLFPPSSDPSAELTSLDVLLAGPVGTPYAGGVWRLHLDIPPTYPNAPPTATFRTRLWHPNIDEGTGAVCVETLKRDWTSTLKLRDVLVTISCLLIQPNPASALNEAAGKLASEDWDGYCRRAKLMTEIHAGIPSSLAAEVQEAQMRGEEKEPELSQKDARFDVRSKGKERAKNTPVAVSKVQGSEEDVENTRRRVETMEPESDPESDWIPGPTKAVRPAASKREESALGMNRYDEMQLDTPPRRIPAATESRAKPGRKDEQDGSDPFVSANTNSQSTTSTSFNLRVPSKPTSSQEQESASTDAPNPPGLSLENDMNHPLLREFSFSWEDSEVLYETGVIKSIEGRSGVVKRLQSTEFEKKKAWELKRFKMAHFDLRKYNRGDFGPKVGIGRL